MRKNSIAHLPLLIIIVTLIFVSGCSEKKSPFYTIAKDPTWQPLNFEQNQGMINTSLSILLLRIAKEKNFRVHLLDVSSIQLLFGLEKNEYDAVLTTLTPDTISNIHFDFSKPLFSLGPVLIVSKDSQITNIKELAGKIIGISPFDNSILIAQQVPESIIRMFTLMPEALDALEKRELDGVLMGAIPAKQLTESLYKGRLKIVSGPLNQEAIRMIVLKGKNQELLEKVNGFLHSTAIVD